MVRIFVMTEVLNVKAEYTYVYINCKLCAFYMHYNVDPHETRYRCYKWATNTC